MTGEERDRWLAGSGLSSAECLICGQSNPPVAEFSFDFFWVRGKRDWPDYTGGPVHRACANQIMKKPACDYEEDRDD